ncbi:dTMP kinase [Fluviispira multicolorata]|uniref:Thymidylate kinase n=1 Tax=Fluviispira multicolorata TaxID=2654512 RepID=A0A833N2U3_9BACT|nr:dTMP kinase [Fluviispira multicolorata]KAB8033293.1 dTMP kinase [Fluviispira multicolorata]
MLIAMGKSPSVKTAFNQVEQMAFIVFEGGEGVGKSTQIELLFTSLKQQGIICTLTREPGGTPFAEDIRSLFKRMSEHGDTPLPLTELLLITAARTQHIQKVIKPELAKGHHVICDRFLDSTYVYQSIVGKVNKQVVDTISQFALQNIIPDLTLVFISDTSKALARIKKEKSRKEDRLDSFSNDIHAQIMNGYREVLNNNFTYPNGAIPKRISIDANASVENVFEQVKTALFNTLGIKL